MTHVTTQFPRTIGMDLGRSKSNYCAFDENRERGDEGEILSTRESIVAFFKAQPNSRVVMEACGPCRWIAKEAKNAGHEVIVANPREFRLISASHKKNDRNDARLLGEFGQLKPSLLHPVVLRGTVCQTARTLLRNRKQLVEHRTELINMIKAAISDLGLDYGPSGSSHTFHKRIVDKIPAELELAVRPLIQVLESIAAAVTAFDRYIERESKEHFTETAMLRQVDGVGPIMALTFVATIEDAARFQNSRDVGAYAGLVPISRNSCKFTPELSISKRGDKALRQALVNAATYILGPRGKDCDLRRWGKSLEDRGGQRSKAKARIAVSRKLAVLLHCLMRTGEVYDPNRNLATAAT